MAATTGSQSFSLRGARNIVGDLTERKPALYWADMLATLAVGYGFVGLYFRSPNGSPGQVAGFIIAGFALFRVGSYIHEITHMRHGQMLGFRIAWNILCGIPMLMPSFFYENHIDHHSSQHYGTERDGEYLRLWGGSLGKFLFFFLQVPLLPVYIGLRFLLSPITFLHPNLRTWVLEHMSSFVINFRHRLTIPRTAPRRVWAALELACCLRMAGMLAVIALGFFPWTRLVQMYCLATFVLGLNYIRNLSAHHYRNAGEPMSHQDQLEDSVNITGHWFWTELFFPLGLRYHALHHVLPSIPFHNLGKAHRRLMDRLPADSPYRDTVYASYWTVVRELWTGRSLREQSQPVAKAA